MFQYCIVLVLVYYQKKLYRFIKHRKIHIGSSLKKNIYIHENVVLCQKAWYCVTYVFRRLSLYHQKSNLSYKSVNPFPIGTTAALKYSFIFLLSRVTLQELSRCLDFFFVKSFFLRMNTKMVLKCCTENVLIFFYGIINVSGGKEVRKIKAPQS